MSCACFHAQKATKLAGYHSPTSRDRPGENLCNPLRRRVLLGEWHSESPLRKSLSPASKKRDHDEFEAEIDALSIHSSDPEEPAVFDPIGKTPKEIATWCAEFERGNRRDMAKPRRGNCRYISSYTQVSCMLSRNAHSHQSYGCQRVYKITGISPQSVKFIPGAQTLLFGALLCLTMREHDQSESHWHVPPCAHGRANSTVFIMLPPAGRHLETGATEDCNLSLFCVWNNFNSVE